MRILLIFMVLSSLALSVPVGKIIDTSVVNIDNTYPGSENEFIAGSSSNLSRIVVVNPTDTDMVACIYSLTAAACSDNMLVPANSFRGKQSSYIVGLFIRSLGATITSGNVEGSGE